jgi:hypothetical protein
MVYTKTMEILAMPRWKSKILNTVAWMLGMRGEYVYCITMNVDLNDPEQAKELLKNERR